MYTISPIWMPENKMKLIKFFIMIGFVLTIASALIMGCGKKAPPSAPYFFQLSAVTGLDYAIIDEKTLKLSWDIPMLNGNIIPKLDGFKIYRSKLSLTDCQNCPLRFELVKDIPIEMINLADAKQTKNQMHYFEDLAMGYNYTYKIKSYGKGAKSKNSDEIRFNF